MDSWSTHAFIIDKTSSSFCFQPPTIHPSLKKSIEHNCKKQLGICGIIILTTCKIRSATLDYFNGFHNESDTFPWIVLIFIIT